MVVNENFANAIQIADKFHVIKNGLEYLQAIRIRLKQEELKNQREEQIIHDKQYKESKDKNLIGPKMKTSKGFKPKRLANGDTAPELLSRSRYLLAISQGNWNEYQVRRANTLFQKYPTLKQAYQCIIDFREWYKPKAVCFEPFTNEKELGNWIDKAESNPSNEKKTLEIL